MTSPVFERVRCIAADVLKLPASQITPQSSPENIEGWDSVQHLKDATGTPLLENTQRK